MLAGLLRLLGAQPRLHRAIDWDTQGRVRTAICSECDREIGVTTKGQMLRHGPLGRDCPGTGGETDRPGIGPGNAAAAMRARNAALAGRRRRRGKR